MSMTESERLTWWDDGEAYSNYIRPAVTKRLAEYEDIGTVSEFRELKEKATAKKAIVSRSKHEAYCPNCKSVVADDEFWALDEYVHHCECGQAILGTDWSEGKER